MNVLLDGNHWHQCYWCSSACAVDQHTLQWRVQWSMTWYLWKSVLVRGLAETDEDVAYFLENFATHCHEMKEEFRGMKNALFSRFWIDSLRLTRTVDRSNRCYAFSSVSAIYGARRHRRAGCLVTNTWSLLLALWNSTQRADRVRYWNTRLLSVWQNSFFPHVCHAIRLR